METTLNIDLMHGGQEFVSPGWGAGDWRILNNLFDVPGGRWVIIASNTSPNGWSVIVDDTASPTTATVVAPFGLSGFKLRHSLVQSSTAPDTYVTEVLNPPDGYSIGYGVSVFSSTIVSGQGAVYGGTWNVESRGPMAKIEKLSDDYFDGISSIVGWLRITQVAPEEKVLVDRIGNPFTFLWEVRPYDGLTTYPPIQTGVNTNFVIFDELEPGDRYEVRLTVTNSFGKKGSRPIYVDGEALVAFYDKKTGSIRILYKYGGLMRFASYYQPAPPVLGSNHSSIVLTAPNQSAHSVYRYGQFLYAALANSQTLESATEGKTWIPQASGGSIALYGQTIHPSGSMTNRLFRIRSQNVVRFAQTSLASAPETTGLEGFKRPSVLLNIGNTFLLVAKLGNGVVCASSQDGITWGGGGVVATDARLLGAFKTADHSMVSVMVLPRGGTPQLVRLFYADTGWDIHDATTVGGLPATLRTPASVDSDGVQAVMVYADGDEHGMAISKDLGFNWQVVED